MTIRLSKYIEIDAGVRGADALPWVPPVFDPADTYALLLEGTGRLLLENGEPILLERETNG